MHACDERAARALRRHYCQNASEFSLENLDTFDPELIVFDSNGPNSLILGCVDAAVDGIVQCSVSADLVVDGDYPPAHRLL